MLLDRSCTLPEMLPVISREKKEIDCRLTSSNVSLITMVRIFGIKRAMMNMADSATSIPAQHDRRQPKA